MSAKRGGRKRKFIKTMLTNGVTPEKRGRSDFKINIECDKTFPLNRVGKEMSVAKIIKKVEKGNKEI